MVRVGDVFNVASFNKIQMFAIIATNIDISQKTVKFLKTHRLVYIKFHSL